MSRYYNIEITNVDGSPFSTFTSFPKTSTNPSGATDLGALQVEFDLPVYTLGDPMSGAHVIIWGVSLQQISQSTDFNGKLIKIYGGFQAGLPLANPKQQGLLCSGVINQAWGNWVGINQALELIVVTDGGLLDQKLNLVLPWKKGQALGSAIKDMLAIACPTYQFEDRTSSNLILGSDEPAYFHNLLQFAKYVTEVSRPLLGIEDYPGVQILLQDNKFTIFDGTLPGAAKDISYLDLIGQPTWQELLTIQFAVAMRADIIPAEYIRLPNTITTRTGNAGFAQFRDNSIFQGVWQVSSIRHLGNFREADPLAWITVITANSPFGGNT